MLLNNQEIAEEIKEEIKRCIQTNDNENTTTQNHDHLYDGRGATWTVYYSNTNQIS